MTLSLDHTDPTEVDDFFRRGEQYSLVPGSLTPPMGVDIAASAPAADVESDLLGSALPPRSPEQIARRARYMRYVSATMGTLVTGLILVFANQAYATRRPAAVAAHDPLPESARQERLDPPSAGASSSDTSTAEAVEPDVARQAPAELGMRPPSSVLPTSVQAANSGSPSVGSKAPAVVAAVEIRTAPIANSQDDRAKAASPKVAAKSREPVTKSLPTGARRKGAVRPVAAQASIGASDVAQKPANYKPPTASFSD